MKFFSLLTIFTFFISTDLLAYWDPGTGSFIIQAIVALFGAIVVYISYPLRIIKNFFGKIFGKDKKKESSIQSVNDKKN